jgi:GNAT superfamily N-acetyltransferase
METNQEEYQKITIRPTIAGDKTWIHHVVNDLLGGIPVISPGGHYDPANIPGFNAIQGGTHIGLLNYCIHNDECEIVTLVSLNEGKGIGSRLIEEIKRRASEQRCRRLWLVTTNDNLHALGFYQKRGFRLAKIHHNAMDEVRRVKTGVPQTGQGGIPLRDTIELEISL